MRLVLFLSPVVENTGISLRKPSAEDAYTVSRKECRNGPGLNYLAIQHCAFDSARQRESAVQCEKTFRHGQSLRQPHRSCDDNCRNQR